MAVRRSRLDAELVRRGLARSREQAAVLISTGRVLVAGVPATKSATGVSADAALRVLGTDQGAPEYVSRGGHKLADALRHFASGTDPLTVAGKRCLDAGASTGGFTDALLRTGACEVVAVDVGYGQLAWALRNDARVRVLERTNIRTLVPGDIGGEADLTVADLSFISLRTVLPSLRACTRDDGDLVLLVKPQFEVGRQNLGKRGVVREPALRRQAIVDVARAARAGGLRTRDVTASRWPGPQGNVEYLLWLTGRGFRESDPGLGAQSEAEVEALAEAAVLAGPQ